MTPVRPLAADPELIRIGNCSGFYGDRFSAMEEMLTGGHLDVLTGDYLAELTMLILGRERAKDPNTGYAKTFLAQLESCLGLVADTGVRVVVNAGGLNPAGLAARVRALAGGVGVDLEVAHVEGDDLTERAQDLGLGDPLTANAYLGARGIAECLSGGADIVITGRVTDASLVVGPAVAHFAWSETDYDRLAGAVVAGHVIECGAQATGGNYAFFTEVEDLLSPGFPLAEVHRDGSSVITKHPGSGGVVNLGTVTAQLMYEIQDARYGGPDVTTRIDTIRLSPDGEDRVRIEGTRGEPPPPQLKVSLNRIGGYRNQMEFVLTGLDIEAKADLARRQLESRLKVNPDRMEWTLTRLDRPDADSEETASALLRCVARDPDPGVVGRAFSGAAVELALAGYPGFWLTSTPRSGSAYGVFTAGWVPQDEVSHLVVMPDGSRHALAAPSEFAELHPEPEPPLPEPLEEGPTALLPLGTLAGARSGDKGGSANIGVWVRSDLEWRWLARFLSVQRLRQLLPETEALPVTRTLLPNLRAVNFVIGDILGEGVASQARFDPQAKGLGEWLRSRHVEIPRCLLP